MNKREEKLINEAKERESFKLSNISINDIRYSVFAIAVIIALFFVENKPSVSIVCLIVAAIPFTGIIIREVKTALILVCFGEKALYKYEKKLAKKAKFNKMKKKYENLK